MVFPRDIADVERIEARDRQDDIIDERTGAPRDNLAGFLPDVTPKPRKKKEPFETQPFVTDFLAENGITQDTERFEIDPESVLGRQGFRTQEEVRTATQFGEKFGPHLGSLVPEGGLVLSEGLTPFLRTFPGNRATRSITRNKLASGDFFAPPGGIDPSLFGDQQLTSSGIMGGEEVNQAFDRGPFQPPELEEALSFFAPTEVYKVRLADYITATLARDAPEVERVNSEHDAAVQELRNLEGTGEIDRTQFNQGVLQAEKIRDDQLANLFTEQSSFDLEDQAIELINRGTPAEQLPLFTETQNVIGANVQNLFNQRSGELETTFNEQQANIPEFRGQTGREEPTQSEFFSYVERLGLAPEFAEFMRSRYFFLLEQWGNSGRETSFVRFANDYFASGG